MDADVVTRGLAVAVVALLALALKATPAHAERIVLRNGYALDASDVSLTTDGVRATLRRGGGTVRVTYAYGRIEPLSLMRLLERHADPEDAAARLRMARAALEAGLYEEAVDLHEQAAELDPALGVLRDKALATVRARRVAEAMADIERLLREGEDPRDAATLAGALLVGPLGGSLRPVERQRVRTLARLAQRMVERQAAAANAGAAQPAGPLPAQPSAGPPAPVDRLAALEAKARAARERAADPSLDDARALRHLEQAAVALLDARRLLQSLPTQIVTSLGDRPEALFELLLATWLDIADIYRLARWFDEAHTRIRAVLILDPGNPGALELRRLVQADLVGPALPGAGYLPGTVWVRRWVCRPVFPPCGPPIAVRLVPHRVLGFGYRGHARYVRARSMR